MATIRGEAIATVWVNASARSARTSGSAWLAARTGQRTERAPQAAQDRVVLAAGIKTFARRREPEEEKNPRRDVAADPGLQEQ